jgi:hypothetical protein
MRLWEGEPRQRASERRLAAAGVVVVVVIKSGRPGGFLTNFPRPFFFLFFPRAGGLSACRLVARCLSCVRVRCLAVAGWLVVRLWSRWSSTCGSVGGGFQPCPAARSSPLFSSNNRPPCSCLAWFVPWVMDVLCSGCGREPAVMLVLGKGISLKPASCMGVSLPFDLIHREQEY